MEASGGGFLCYHKIGSWVVGADSPAVAHHQTRNQYVQLLLGSEAQATAAATAVTIELIDSAQVGIGMLMPSHHLARLTRHRPTLQVQRQRHRIKSERLQVGPGKALQLIHTIEVPCPGAERIGVGLRLPTQGQHGPHQHGGFQRIGWQGHLGESQGKQRLEGHSRGGHGHSSSTSPFIRADGLSKSYRVATKDPGLAGTLRHFLQRPYKDVAAVRDVRFQIQSGEMVRFPGANGAGKTTTLNMLTGLIHRSARPIFCGPSPW